MPRMFFPLSVTTFGLAIAPLMVMPLLFWHFDAEPPPHLWVAWGGVAIACCVIAADLRPPKARLRADRFEIKSFLYRDRIAFADIIDVLLSPRLPDILSNINGTAIGSSLRGTFEIETYGVAKLFVQLDHPPYLIIRHTTGVTAVGLANASETQFFHKHLRNQIDAAARDREEPQPATGV